MQTNVLALDLGTNTGFAVGRPGAIITGTQSFKNDRHSGGGMRFLRFKRFLSELHAATPITEVVYEEVRRHLGTDAAHIYGGLQATLTAWCEEQTPKIPYEGVPVGTIKKYATGKGNADKKTMIAAVRTWGYEPADDNEADAIALWHLRATTTFGESADQRPQSAKARVTSELKELIA